MAATVVALPEIHVGEVSRRFFSVLGGNFYGLSRRWDAGFPVDEVRGFRGVGFRVDVLGGFGPPYKISPVPPLQNFARTPYRIFGSLISKIFSRFSCLVSKNIYSNQEIEWW